ncbi:Protein HIRA [Meloidogyne graminicola]|uniref:Protein HIRA n=1 Tax=Meloidogyne graminicola TaxID=189291 RepID=A0A8S9ZMJ9_9BILA|nr:Protein HIRA [Meloidogyne graminicola]
MRLYDVPWISHEGGNIFSLDIHPSGSKLATAGQDGGGAGLLIVWDLEFLNLSINESTEVMPLFNNYPMARIPHSSSINCVRWTRDPSSKRLVCGGDDPVLCIYECTGVYSSMGSIDQPSSSSTFPSEQQEIKRKVENYRCTHKLFIVFNFRFGHSLDVLHLDWSPDGKYLASCSLDNTIIIWNARKLPEKLTTLKQSGGGHSRGVKGLSWDPVGRFLATQAEDNTLKIWQTDSWTCVHTFSEPFAESAISTLFCRMDWSPDGCFLVAPCAMNNGGPTAKIFLRRDWSYSRDLVGFRKAVCAVRANTHCFQLKNYSGTHSTFACFAIGSRDRSISVWLMPNFARPLVVIEKVFNDSVVDLSKLTLAACSKDGVVRILKFSDNEIGNMLSEHETALILEKLYGIRHNSLDDLTVVNNDSFSSNDVQNSSFPSSSDFGYTSICESLARRAAETTINNESELFKVAFGRETSKRRFPMEMFVKRAKKQKNGSDQRRSTPNGFLKSSRHLYENGESNGINIGKIALDKRLYERGGEENGFYKNTREFRRKIFELPERKRILVAKIEKEEDSSINFIEVINNYPIKSFVESRIARLCGYRNEKRNGKDLLEWTFFSRRHISLLCANRIWTAIATSDAHFLTFSTLTGRLHFDICLVEPTSFFQHLNEEILLIGGFAGTISVWNIPQRRQLMQQSIASLFSYQNQQLISAILLPQLNTQNGAEENEFAGIDLKFSDLSVYRYLPNSNGWSKINTLFDFLKNNEIPDNIFKGMLPLSRFALLIKRKSEFCFIFGNNVTFIHSMPKMTSDSLDETKNFTNIQREEERRFRLNQISNAMTLYIKSINEKEKFVRDEIIAFERGKRHLANIMGVDPETMTQDLMGELKQIDTSIKYLFPSGLFSLKARPVMQPYSLDPIKKIDVDKNGNPRHTLFYTLKPHFFSILSDINRRTLRLVREYDQRQLALQRGEINLDNAKEGTPLPMNRHYWITKEVLQQKTNGEKITAEMFAGFIMALEYMCCVIKIRINYYSQLPNASLEQEFIDDYRTLRSGNVEPGNLVRLFASKLHRTELPIAHVHPETGLLEAIGHTYVKTTLATALVTTGGTGKITIDGYHYDILRDIQAREILLSPLIVTGLLGKVDIEAKIIAGTGGKSATPRAIRTATALALASLYPDLAERLRLAGLLNFDKRRKERRKPSQKGARARWIWRKLYFFCYSSISTRKDKIIGI